MKKIRILLIGVISLGLILSCDKKNKYSIVNDTYKMQQYKVDTSLFQVLDVIISKEELNKDIDINPFLFFEMSVGRLSFSNNDSTSYILDYLRVIRLNLNENTLHCYDDENFDSFFSYRNATFCFVYSSYFATILYPTNQTLTLNVSYPNYTNSNYADIFYYIDIYEWIVNLRNEDVLIEYYSSIEANIKIFDTVVMYGNGNTSNVDASIELSE